jgi:hypothetical protein
VLHEHVVLDPTAGLIVDLGIQRAALVSAGRAAQSVGQFALDLKVRALVMCGLRSDVSGG